MKIGPYRLASPYLLAPIAGVSEMPFRILARELGASLASTELISAEGLLRKNIRTMPYLRHDPSAEHPFCVQLFGGHPQHMAQAARVAVDHGAQIIDINMGCPVPKVTRGGAGSALMLDHQRAAAIVEQVRAASQVPVTVKIRSGWDSQTINAVPLAKMLEQAGACMIAVHARTRAQGYSGRADWSVITEVKRTVKISVVGNGDVTSKQDAQRMQTQTGCDAVMVGRAAMGNPWIFRQLNGGPPPTAAERRALILRHFEEHLELFGHNAAGIRSFRQTLLWYAHGLYGAAHFRAAVTLLEEIDAVRQAITEFFARSPEAATSAT